MLSGATQIIGDIPGKNLNPLLLAQSQWNDSSGYMIISYTRHREMTDEGASRFFDIFFLRGSHIYDCARMNADLRRQLHLDVALQTFNRLGRDECSRLFLFSAPQDDLERFRSTFFLEPSLKVHLRGMSRKQLHRLLSSTKCGKGLIECNDFVRPLPSIDLKLIAAPDDVAQYNPPLKHGRILIYDIDRHDEFLDLKQDSCTESRSLQNGQASASDRGNISRNDIAGTPPPGMAVSATDEKEAEEFSAFMTRFLQATPTSLPIDSAVVENPSSNSGSVEIPPQDDLFIVTHRGPGEVAAINNESGSNPPIHRRDHKPRRKPKANQAGSPPRIPPESTDFVRLFERLIRSFRQQVFEAFGDKSDDVISKAEGQIRFITREFDLRSLTQETAVFTLDLIERVANEASFLKRPRLRQAALTLVADLYNKQYEILEKNRAIDRVEQFYYRLKK